MTLKRIVLPIILIVLVLFVQCSILDELAQVQKPTAKVGNIKLTGFNFNEISLNIDVLIQNPNAFGVKLASYDYSLSTDNSELLSGQQPSGIQVLANTQSKLTVPVTVEFKKLYSFITGYKNQDSTQLDFAAGLGFELPVIGPIRVPVSHQLHVPNVKLPKISLGHLKINSMNFTGATLDFLVNVENNNYFDLLMKNFNFDLKVNGTSWADGALSSAKKLNNKKSTEYHIPVKLDFLKMGTTVFQLLSQESPSLDYSLDGKADFGSSLKLFEEMALPIQESGKVNLIK